MSAGQRTLLLARLRLLQAGFSAEGRQALGFAWALRPALRRAWAAPGDFAAACARQLAGVNMNPFAAGMVAGLVWELEDRAARAQGAEREALLERQARLKSSCAAGLSAAADAFFWGALRPAASLAALLLGLALLRAGAAGWALWPSAALLLAWNIPGVWAQWRGLERARRGSEEAVAWAAALPAARACAALRAGAAVLGLAVMAAGLCEPRARGELDFWIAASFCAGGAFGRGTRREPWILAGLVGLAVWGLS